MQENDTVNDEHVDGRTEAEVMSDTSYRDIAIESDKELDSKESNANTNVNDTSVNDVKDTTNVSKSRKSNINKSGEIGKAAQAQSLETQVSATQVPQAQNVQRLQPRNFWKPDEKEFFNSLPDAAKEKFLNMFNTVERSYEKKSRDLETRYKQYEPTIAEYAEFNKAFEPYEEEFKRTGAKKSDYVKHLVEQAEFSQRDPINFIGEMMTVRGITPDMLASGLEEYFARINNPVYKPVQQLNQQVSQLQQRLNAQEENERRIREQQEMQKGQAELERLKNQTDENGNLKYPYLTEVAAQMNEIYKLTGETDFDKLYDKAVRLNDDTIERLVEERVKQQQYQQQNNVQNSKRLNATAIRLTNSPNVTNTVNAESYKDMDYREIAMAADEELNRLGK